MRRRILPLTLLGLILTSGFGLLWKGKLSRAQSDTTDTATDSQPSPPQPRELDFPYYSLRGGFNSLLQLVSDSPGPFSYTITIRSLAGQAVTAPEATIQPGQKLSIDLGTLIANLGADPLDAFSEGSVSVRYVSATRPLLGQVTISNPTAHLAFESLMTENDPGESSIPETLDGLWWGLATGRDARVMVANAAGVALSADVFLDFAGERHASDPLDFAPYETKVFSITKLLGKLKFSPSQAPEGGITVIGRGTAPALIAAGAMMDPSAGFSTTMHFTATRKAMSNSLDASGVPIGAPSADSPFAGAGNFTPHVVVRNLLSSPQTATVSIAYPTDDGTQTVTLAPLAVGAYSTEDFSLGLAMGQLPLPLPFCTLHIQYSGPPGSAVAEVSSVEENHDLVIDSKLGDASDPASGSGINPWRLDDHTESFIFLTDAGDEPVRIGFQIHANDVTYYVTDLKLKPHETRAIDIRKLRDAQKADFKGNTIPAEATDGGVFWVKMDKVPVIGRVLVMNTPRGVSSNFDCACTFHCAVGYKALSVTPTSVALLPGQTMGCTATETWGDCNGWDHFYNVTTSCTWTSSNTAVATIGSTGVITAKAGGSTTLTASFTDDAPKWFVADQICLDNFVTKTSNSTCTVTAPYPINFTKKSSSALASGQLVFTYEWSSSTRKITDLANCKVGEFVTYPGYVPGNQLVFLWPNPPWPSTTSPNPTTNITILGNNNSCGTGMPCLTDQHAHGAFGATLAAASFTATEYYEYACPGINSGNPVVLAGPISIVRSTTNGGTIYRITKSGASASCFPLSTCTGN